MKRVAGLGLFAQRWRASGIASREPKTSQSKLRLWHAGRGPIFRFGLPRAPQKFEAITEMSSGWLEARIPAHRLAEPAHGLFGIVKIGAVVTAEIIITPE